MFPLNFHPQELQITQRGRASDTPPTEQTHRGSVGSGGTKTRQNNQPRGDRNAEGKQCGGIKSDVMSASLSAPVPPVFGKEHIKQRALEFKGDRKSVFVSQLTPKRKTKNHGASGRCCLCSRHGDNTMPIDIHFAAKTGS